MNFLNNGDNKMTKSKSFNEYILNDLKTDDDIKEWINIGFQEFLQDNDLNAFVILFEFCAYFKICFVVFIPLDAIFCIMIFLLSFFISYFYLKLPFQKFRIISVKGLSSSV